MMMLTTYLPLVTYRLPPIIGSHHFYVGIFVLSLFAMGNKVLLNRFALLMFGYGIFSLLMQKFVWINISEWSEDLFWFSDYYSILIGTLVLFYFYESKDFKGLAIICKYSLIFIFITSIGTIAASFVMDSAERLRIFGDSAEAQEVQAVFAKYGSGGYNGSIIFMSVIAIVVYYIKNINQFFVEKKWILRLSIVLFFMAILRLQIFTNVLFAFAVLLFSLINAKSRGKLFVIASIVLVIVSVIPTTFYVDILLSLGRLFEGTLSEVSYKFTELAAYLEFGPESIEENNALASRAARAPILAEAFLNYPFAGFLTSPETKLIESYGVYHLYWFSVLAKFGLVNFILYIHIFYKFIMMQKKYLRSNYFYYFMIAIMAVILYGIPKVTGGREAWYFVFVIAPGCYYLPLLNNNFIKNLLNIHKKETN